MLDKDETEGCKRLEKVTDLTVAPVALGGLAGYGLEWTSGRTWDLDLLGRVAKAA